MKPNIPIDDDLMEAAMQATGMKSKKETVELGLQTLAVGCVMAEPNAPSDGCCGFWS